MLLGKRPRPPMKRTTSMTGITVDIPSTDASDSEQPSSDHHHHATVGPEGPPPAHQIINFGHNNNVDCEYDHYDQRLLTAMMLSPRNFNYHHHHHLEQQQQQQQQQRITSKRSSEFIETAHFLTTCGLCKRRLAPGKDIYMYRGDTAFCSSECREQKMKQDERKEKIAASSSKNKEESSITKMNAASSCSKKSEITVATAY